MSDRETILAAIKEILGDPYRYGLTWRRLPATVVDASDSTDVSIVLDGDEDDNIVSAVSLLGGGKVGDRVMVDVVPPAGLYIIGQTSATPYPAYRYLETVTFTSTTVGTSTDYIGIRGFRQRLVGAGGGGGGSATTGVGTCASAGGGGGGGYSESFLTFDDINTSSDGWTVTIGALGTGGAAGANAGNAGTNTTAGGFAAAGGAGGLQGTVGAGLSTSAGGNGGGASGNILASNGDDGGNGFRANGIAQGTGIGGASVLGGQRKTNTGNNGGAGQSGRVQGCGGSGSYLQASQTQVAGGDGTAGWASWDLFI